MVHKSKKRKLNQALVGTSFKVSETKHILLQQIDKSFTYTPCQSMITI